SGASWIQASQFRADGPVSRGILAFSQSLNPESPHRADMTRKYSQKRWVDLPFSESDVAAATIESAQLTESPEVCRDGGWQESTAPAYDSESDCVDRYESLREQRLAEIDDRHGTTP